MSPRRRKRPLRRGRNTVTGLRFEARAKRAYFSVYVPGGRGIERRRGSAPAENFDEALAKFNAWKAEVLATPSSEAPLTFGSFMRRYLPQIKRSVSLRTAREYEYVVVRHLLPRFGNSSLEKISTASVREFEDSLRSSGYAHATIHGYVNVLLIMLRRAVDEYEVIEHYPIQKRLRRKKPRSTRRGFTDRELAQLMDVMDDEKGFRAHLARTRSFGAPRESERFPNGPRRFGAGVRPDGEAAAEQFRRFRWMKPLFVVAVNTGLRRGDLLKLRWAEVDMSDRTLTTIMQKTNRAVTVPLSRACLDSLRVCRDRAPKSRVVFTDESGDPISATRLRRAFELARTLAELPGAHFHDFRHTFGSRLVARNVNFKTISELMGHSSVTMTEQYAKVSRESLDGAREALDR